MTWKIKSIFLVWKWYLGRVSIYSCMFFYLTYEPYSLSEPMMARELMTMVLEVVFDHVLVFFFGGCCSAYTCCRFLSSSLVPSCGGVHRRCFLFIIFLILRDLLYLCFIYIILELYIFNYNECNTKSVVKQLRLYIFNYNERNSKSAVKQLSHYIQIMIFLILNCHTYNPTSTLSFLCCIFYIYIINSLFIKL